MELVRNAIAIVTEDAILQARVVKRVSIFFGIAVAVLAT